MADPIFTPAVDAGIASAAGKTTFWAAITSAVSSIVGGVDWLSIGGFLIALCGLCVSWYFKRAQGRRDADFKDRQLQMDREFRQREDDRAAKAADDAHAEHVARMRREELDSQMGRAVGMQSAQVDE